MSGYIGTQPVPQATQTRDAFTATSGQTSFATSGYTPNFLDVFLNGVKMAAADYTASNGSDVVLATGAATGDILEVVAYTNFDTANVTGAANFTVTGSFTSQGIDDNANATAITIDASENVLVGTTSSNYGVVGSQIGTGGNNYMTRSGAQPLLLNRLSSDGDVLLLMKDSTTVGSIGVASSDQLYFAAADGAGLKIDSDLSSGVTPCNSSGANLDASINIGHASARWKDLYLSGGVYLGGTGAANKLTDFETGTFTPSLTFGGASVGITYSSSRRYGIYTKIGNVVTYFIHLELTSKGSSTGGANITGLPFTATSANGNQNYVPGAVFISNMASLSTVPVVRSLSGTTSMDIYQMINSQYSGITNANYTNTTGFQVSGHYYVA